MSLQIYCLISQLLKCEIFYLQLKYSIDMMKLHSPKPYNVGVALQESAELIGTYAVQVDTFQSNCCSIL